MTDSETLTAPASQVLRSKMVQMLTPYRGLVSVLPIPSYLREPLMQAIHALDRWTRESETAGGNG